MAVDPVGHRRGSARRGPGSTGRSRAAAARPRPPSRLPPARTAISSPANGSVVLGEPQLPAELRAQVQLALGDVALALAQAAQLRVHLGGLGVQLLLRLDRGLGELVLASASSASHGRAGRGRSAGGGRRTARRSRPGPAGLRRAARRTCSMRGSCRASRACAALLDLPLDLGEPVAAVAGALDGQAGLPLPQARPAGRRARLRWQFSRGPFCIKPASCPSRSRAL